jgi:hypothetical protein
MQRQNETAGGEAMTKLETLVIIVLAFALLLMIPQRNRAANRDRSPEMANGAGPTFTNPTFTNFDCPNAGTLALQGTGGMSINKGGAITGFCVLAGSGDIAHGFVRTAGGAVTVFDAPGAGTVKHEGTFPTSINAGGVITGMVDDANSVYHGFVGTVAGGFTTFNAPGAKLDLDAGTIPMSINTAGTITGMYRDTNLVYHGFVRATDGTIKTFDAPGAGTGYIQGTRPLFINAAGTITGYYEDANYVHHGFVRTSGGTISTIDAPGAGTNPGQSKGLAFQGTNGVSINAGGAITGAWADSNYAVHGFVRATDGTITEFDVTGAGGAGTFGTISGALNTWGGIAGLYQGTDGVIHGFQRTPDGTITTFDDPNAGTTGTLPGTAGISMNDSWVITGAYSDPNSVFHSFHVIASMFAWASVSPTSLSFGTQAIDTTSAAKAVTLTSAGTSNLLLSGIAIAGANKGDFAQTNNCPATLAPGKKCTVNVTFTPSQLGSRSASLTFTDNAAGSPQTVALTGKGVAQATVSPTSLTFAAQTVGTTSAAKNVTLTNNLPTTLTINGISFTGADPGDFAQTNTCDGSVPAKGKCTISVTFTPKATGMRTATLTVSDSANNSPQTVAVTGTGQ